MKKYALNNSYFKNVKYSDLPQTPFDVFKYYKKNGELPFRYDGDNWIYATYCEYQKKHGIFNSEFFTPDAVADQLVNIAIGYFDPHGEILDACCGFGQLTKALMKLTDIEESGYDCTWEISGFDCSNEFSDIYKYFTGCKYIKSKFKDYVTKCDFVVSNPPFETPILIEFLLWLYESLNADGVAVLIVPKGFFDKTRPKKLTDVLKNFFILHRENAAEKFARTATFSEIVAIRKN